MAMLTDLRESSQSFLIYILFGILIFVFIFFFGPQAEGCDPNPAGLTARVGWAASIEGEEITQQMVEGILRGQRVDSLDDAALAQVRRRTLLSLVDQVRRAQRAEAAGITVTEDELSAYITDKDKNPDIASAFDPNGRFIYDRFVSIVTQGYGLTLDSFRRMKRWDLLAQKHRKFLASQVRVGEPEIRTAWERRERKYNLEYAAFGPDTVPADAVQIATAEEASAWAKANADAVKTYYEENETEFRRDKEVKIRRVLLKVPKDAADAAKAEVKAKAEKLLADARAEGADFAAIAKASSEGFYKDQGGDMGWRSTGNSSKDDYAVFTKLEAGQVSDVQETPIGLWFAKAEEVRPAIDKKLEEVEGEIAQKLLAGERRTAAVRTRAEAFLAEAAGKPDLESVLPKPEPAEGEEGAEGEAAAAEKAPGTPDIAKTGSFSDERFDWATIPRIGKSPELARAIAGLTTEAPLLKDVLAVDDTLYVVRLAERTEPDEAAYADARTDIELRLRQQRAGALLRKLDETLPEAEADPTVRINGDAFPTALPAEATDKG